MRTGSRSPARLWLGGRQSPATAGLGQGAPAPATVALGADLVPGGNAVLVLICELVDLVGQLLHCAGPEATAKAPQALEVVHTLAVALYSDAGGVRTAGEGTEANMRSSASRWGPSRRDRGILGPEGTGNCYRLRSCRTALKLPGAREEESCPCPPRASPA